jgi:hypothetical protein
LLAVLFLGIERMMVMRIVTIIKGRKYRNSLIIKNNLTNQVGYINITAKYVRRQNCFSSFKENIVTITGTLRRRQQRPTKKKSSPILFFVGFFSVP